MSAHRVACRITVLQEIFLTTLSPVISVVRNSTAATAEVDGQLVALDVTKGTCYGLNRVATRIWQLIEQPTTVGQVVASLLGEYDVEPALCEAQTLELFDDLLAAGLITKG